jgi:mannose-6-phosphate isomerase-like protein (cupin superfamily)
MTAPAFPGGTSVTRLSVYDDGGGSPHLHTVSTEAYVVIGGSGAVQTLDRSGFTETPLTAGSTVWFSPGVIHRAVNHGDLHVVVVMSNAGLPEAGDAVLTFPPDVVAEPHRYAAAATIPADRTADEAVRRRRALAVTGFERLAEAMRAGDPGPLETFYDSAAALVRPRVGDWRRIWESTVEPETRRTAAMLDALAVGDGDHLRAGSVLGSPPGRQTRWGMCGHLHPLDPQR